MKKIIAVCLAAVMVLALAACGKSGKGGGADNGGAAEVKAARIADDTSTMKMRFPAPADFVTVARSIDKTADGVITEKNITYTFADETELIYAYGTGIVLSEVLNLDSMESAEYCGLTFYIRSSGNTMQALAQDGDDVYGINYELPDAESRDLFDGVLNAITLDGDKTSADNDGDLYDIQYTIDSAWNLVSTYTSVTETKDGEISEKNFIWRFGEDKDNISFRFRISVFRNATLADKLDEDEAYTEQEINGVTYSVLTDSESEKVYDCLTQHGSDVYEIKNLGASNGYFSSRSEESDTAFESFLNGVSFK